MGPQQMHSSREAAGKNPGEGQGLSVAGGQGVVIRAERVAGGAESACVSQARTQWQGLEKGLGRARWALDKAILLQYV